MSESYECKVVRDKRTVIFPRDFEARDFRRALRCQKKDLSSNILSIRVDLVTSRTNGGAAYLRSQDVIFLAVL